MDLLVDWRPDPEIRPIVMRFAAAVKSSSDSYLFHDDFEETNDRLYFLDFVDRAGAAHLQLLGDAHLVGMFAHGRAPATARAALARMTPGLLMREQARDFLTCRSFRETLLCRKGVPLRRRIEPDTMSSLCFGSILAPTRQPVDVRTEEPVTFEATGRPRVTTSMPILKAALTHLRVQAQESFLSSEVDTHVTNLRHERIQLDAISRCVLSALDGAPDRARITTRVREKVGRDLSEDAVGEALRGLASCGLLLA